MKRNVKNIIMILLMIAMIVLSYFTMKDVKSVNNVGQMMGENQNQQNSGTPPTKPEDNNNESSDNKTNTPPEMPQGSSNNSENGIPSAKPEDNSNETSENKTNTPPEMPQGSSNNSENGTPPAKPEDNNNESSENKTNTPPEMPQGNSNNNMQQPPERTEEKNENQLRTIHYIMFGIEGVIFSICLCYLIFSKVNKLTLNEVMNKPVKLIIFVVVTIIITIALIFFQSYITNKIFKTENSNNQGNMQMMPGGNIDSASVTKTGANTIDGTTEDLSESYTTSQSDESVILVQNGGNATIDGAEVTKTGGDSSNTENSEFYGVNSGILVTEKSTATIKNATISTNAKGSNAVFSTGTDSKIYISDSKITTTGSGSARGLDATYGGYIEADNVTITTRRRKLCNTCNR